MAKTGKTILGTYFARGRVNKYQQIFILGWLILGLGIALGFSSETAPGNPGVNESPDIFEQTAVKLSAIKLLGSLKSEEGAAALFSARLGNNPGLGVSLKLLSHKNRRVRYQAADALGEMKDVLAVKVLEKAVGREKDTAVKGKIQSSLGKLKALLAEKNEIK